MELQGKYRKIVDNLIEMKDVVVPIVGEDVFTVAGSDGSAMTAKALRDGRFAEPALVDNLLARTMLNENIDAELASRKDEPIRVNKGLEFPDPAMKDAERFLRYKTLWELYADRSEDLWRRHIIPYE